MKKGFTLAELLGVMVILGIIALIITPVITDTVNQSEQKAYEKQIYTIETAAKEWGIENVDELPNAGKKCISVQDLIDSGKIQNSSIINPQTNEEMNGWVIISFNSEYKQHEYKYTESSEGCS